MRWLRETGTIAEVEQEYTQSEDLVVYFNGDTPTYAGNMRDARVVSKWGQGLLYEHAIDEIPWSYGCECRFFEHVATSDAESAYKKFEFDEKVELSTR
jgi:hypothetical protein